jgi:hypothetical protein
MIRTRIRRIGAYFAALLAMSFGIEWGFTYLVARYAKLRSRRDTTAKKE